MANTRKATNQNTLDNDVEKLVEENKVVTKPTANKSKEKELEKQLKESNSTNQMLTDMLAELKSKIEALEKAPTIMSVNSVVDDRNRLVKIINIQPFTMPIFTKEISVRLDGFGSHQSVRFQNMTDIISKYLDWFKDGRIILEKEQDYVDLGIGYIYDDILQLKEVNDIVTFKDKKSIEKILSATGNVREILERLVSKAFLNGEFEDYNKIRELDKNGCQINKLIEAEDEK